MTRIRAVVVAVSVFVLLLGTLFVVTVGRNHDSHGSMLNKAAPAVTLTNLATGKSLAPGALTGKAVIVNFWNSWCIPCRQEEPSLAEFYAKHRSDPNFLMVGIVRTDTASAIRDYVAQQNIHWTVAMDPGGKAAVAYGTTGQPETYAIAPNGVVVGEQFGPTSVSDLDKMLAAAQASA